MALQNPTRTKRDRPSYPTSEALAWPELADVLALVRGGFAYAEALEMSPLECDKALAILSAWAIPSEDRVGGELMAPGHVIEGLYHSH